MASRWTSPLRAVGRAFGFGRSAAPIALASSSAPSTSGPKTRRSKGESSGWLSYGRAEAEKLYGPHNPLCISDTTLALMAEDWTIGSCLEMWATAYQGVEYWIEGPSSELNAFAEQVWRLRHRQWIRVLLQALPWGRGTSEITWDLRDVGYEFVGDRGATRKATRRDAYVIGELRDLDPRRVTVLVDDRGDFAGARVSNFGTPEIVLSAAECLHVVNDQAFGDLRGKALHRRAYSPWWKCNCVYLGLDRYLERKGDPPLTGYAPSEEESDEDGNTQDPIKVTAVLAANLRAGGSSILPGECDPETKQRLYELKEMQVAERAQEFLPTAQHYEALKALGCLTFPDQLGGENSFASRKVGRRSQANLFSDRQDSLILRPSNRWLLPKLIRANFGRVPDSDIPQVRGGRISDNALEILADLVGKAQNAVAVTREGKTVPVHSLFDWQRAIRAIGGPVVDERLIPDDLIASGEQPTAGRPGVIATNPGRPEGPGERGLSRAPIEISGRGFARADTAAAWLEQVRGALGRIDDAVSRAAATVERERAAAEKKIRGVMRSALADARKTEAADGREVVSPRNRDLARRVRDEAEEILIDLDERLLDESDIEAAAFDRRSPLATGHIEAAQGAVETLEAGGLPAPSGRRLARAVKDVARDAKTNGRGQATKEARRAQEIVDRLIQGGADEESVEQAVDTYELPARDLQSSTTAHVRASARAVMASTPVLEAGDKVGGWAVLTSEAAETEIARRFPAGKVADLAYRTFPSAADLDQHYRKLAESQGPQVMTGWRNLGRTFGSQEYYVPIPAGLAETAIALMRERRRTWDAERRQRQQDLDAERAAGTPGVSGE